MNLRFSIDYPKTKAGRALWGKEYSLNAIYSGKHWRRRKADAEYWHGLTHAALRRAGIPRGPAKGPVSVRLWYDDRLDLDNHAYIRKLIIDALTGWVIEGDARRHIRRITEGWHDEGRILVEVETE